MRPEHGEIKTKTETRECKTETETETETKNCETVTETETSLVNSVAYGSNANRYAFIIDHTINNQ